MAQARVGAVGTSCGIDVHLSCLVLDRLAKDWVVPGKRFASTRVASNGSSTAYAQAPGDLKRFLLFLQALTECTTSNASHLTAEYLRPAGNMPIGEDDPATSPLKRVIPLGSRTQCIVFVLTFCSNSVVFGLELIAAQSSPPRKDHLYHHG